MNQPVQYRSMCRRSLAGRSSYPIGAFSGLLGKMARDLSAGGSIATEIIGTELIGFSSLLTQGVADLVWPNGLLLAVGANGLVAAPSGSGKSLVYKILSNAIEQYLEMFPVESLGKHCDLFLEDVTREAILRSLRDWPVAGLFTDEAGMLKRLLKDSATLVKLLDGAPFRGARISTGRLALVGQRVSMLLLEQPEVFEETKRLLGGRKGGVGLINRFFVALLKEHRSINSSQHVCLSDDVAQAYEQRVRLLLDVLVEKVKGDHLARRAIGLSDEAKPIFAEIMDNAKDQCVPGSPWFPVSEYVARHAERVLRLAGVFHIFEYGVDGEITLDTLMRAEQLGNWYIESFARAFNEPPKQTQSELDAGKLYDALVQNYCSLGIRQYPRPKMRHDAINLGLTSGRFDRALAVLCAEGRTQVVRFANGSWVELVMPSLPSY